MRRKTRINEKKLSKIAKEEAYIAEIRAERNSIIGSNIISSRINNQVKWINWNYEIGAIQLFNGNHIEQIILHFMELQNQSNEIYQ